MNSVLSFLKPLRVIFCCYLFLVFPMVGWAEDRILESINVTTERDSSIVDIRLNQQLTVVSYTPLKRASLLRLKVRRTGNAFQVDELPTNFETLPWSPTAELPLYNVTVDLEGAILLYFKRTVKYEVLPGTNAFHIMVKVFHPERITKLPVKVVKKNKIKLTEPEEIKAKEKVVEGEENLELSSFMNEARRAMLNKDYTRAIQLYTKVTLRARKSVYEKPALEFLGLARERNKQFAHAKFNYEKYLKLYPDGEDAERVSQRLLGIITSEADPKEKLKEGKSKDKQKVGMQWNTFGSFSQFYNRHESKFNDDDSRLNRSAIQNGLDITSRIQMQDYQMTSRFSGNYNSNIESSVNDEKRISTAYLDLKQKAWDMEFRVGRQSRSSGGILGRFDGAVLSVPVIEKVQLNFVSGYSVGSSRDLFLNNDQYFYGVNADLGTFDDSWDFNMFFIEQYDHKLLDRRAIGGEVRFFQENQSFFSFLDYDIYHQSLNTFLFTGQWGFSDRTIINLSYDYRTSPFLTTSNATQGQSDKGVETVDELQQFFSINEIKQLAKDRTATSHSAALSLSRPLSEKFQLNGDFRMTTISGTKASGGVEASEGTGFDYFYSMDLTANSLLTEGDIYVLGLRYNDTKSSNTSSININARYPVSKELRVNPRFRFDYRDNENGTKRYAYRPSIRVTHRLIQGLQLEVEAGGEWEFQQRTDEAIAATVSNNDEFDQTKGYFVIVGYRYNF